ncbi:MAG TPA: alanine racemase [Myxococcota bacterium]|nr:alanine racemase [Myxococcota bacterium]
MNRLVFDLRALHHNAATLNAWINNHGADWLVVTKVLCGHEPSLKALAALGVQTTGDSRLENLSVVKKVMSREGQSSWYLRIPTPSVIQDVVKYSEVSLNSEISIIRKLNEEAKRQGKVHSVIIMIELGDLREGILPGSLVDFYQLAFDLPNIEVLGIGSNLGCMAGTVPTVDQFMQLVLYRELLELKFGKKLPYISAGSSSTLPLVLDGQLPKQINHFRIGEALFLGTDLINGGLLPGLRDDAFVLEAEVAELREKSLVPVGEVGTVTPFQHLPAEEQEELNPGQRGYRAVINVGNLDTEVAGLTPENPAYRIAGASSDVTVVIVGEESPELKVGDTMRFRLSYAALLRLMSNRYVTTVLKPPLEEMIAELRQNYSTFSPPQVLESFESRVTPT